MLLCSTRSARGGYLASYTVSIEKYDSEKKEKDARDAKIKEQEKAADKRSSTDKLAEKVTTLVCQNTFCARSLLQATTCCYLLSLHLLCLLSVALDMSSLRILYTGSRKDLC